MEQQITIAGGCFWGVEGFFKKVYGILDTEVGYANGKTQYPSYDDVCFNKTDHVEAVRLTFDTESIDETYIVTQLMRIIDPYSVNRQGGDFGRQYRTGIFCTTEEQLSKVHRIMNQYQSLTERKIMVEIEKLKQFFPAEQYHQDYLDKNPQGYCHIPLVLAEELYIPRVLYSEKRKIDGEVAKVAYEKGTDSPFSHPYTNLFEPGIYVDIVSGEPLFLSNDKYESNCGWPSFSKPIHPDVIKSKRDSSHFMIRTEVIARMSEIHLGHVFNDGIDKLGGLRFCINGSVLEFIPKNQMVQKRYGYLIHFVKD